MLILLKNKHTLQVDDFYFKCSIGKNGTSKKKIEGDLKTPVGTFYLEYLYYRKDRIKKPETKLKCIPIQKYMVWCNDINYPKKYNRLINHDKKVSHEKLFRKDHKYDLLIPIINKKLFIIREVEIAYVYQENGDFITNITTNSQITNIDKSKKLSKFSQN